MTESPEELKARAQRSFERSIRPARGEFHGPVHPTEVARIERVLASLPRMTREIVLAYRVDGYSYAEIAAITGLSVHRVERHMAKAIYRFHRSMRSPVRTTWQCWWEACLSRWVR